MFGEPGSMEAVVSGGIAGATGSWDYLGLESGTTYNWQVISHNSNRSTTNGMVWQFTTAFDPITEFPFTETFEVESPTIDRWSVVSGSGNWGLWEGTGGYGTSTISAMANFYNISGSTPFHLISPPLDTSALPGSQLTFDYAYATYSGEVDRLEVYTSVDNGSSFQLLTGMDGGNDGPLVPPPATTASLVLTAGQWNP